MNAFSSLLARQVVLFDGGFGSMLVRAKLSAACPETLNLSRPDAVRRIHAAYVKAGAQVLETHSLGCNPMQLKVHGFAGDTPMLAKAAVRNAHAAAGDSALVAFSMGTLGAFLAPVGDVTLTQAVEAYAIPARAAAEAGCDLFIIETMTDIADMRAAILAVKPLGLPIVASFTFQPNGRTLTGGTAACAALAAEALGVTALGINCSGGPQSMLAPLAEMRAVSPLPVIVQPNAGLPTLDEQGTAHYALTPQEMAPMMQVILQAGAAGIGGCCGTTPEHIEALQAQAATCPPPAPACAHEPMVSSLRTHLSLRAALESLVTCTLHTPDLGPLYDAEPEEALLLDLRSLSPADVSALLPEAQMACPVPLLLRLSRADALEAALRAYVGRTAVEVPDALTPLLAAYGAHKI